MCGLVGSGTGLMALTWLYAPHRGHLMTRSSASPVNRSRLQCAQRVSLRSIMRKVVAPCGRDLLPFRYPLMGIAGGGNSPRPILEQRIEPVGCSLPGAVVRRWRAGPVGAR